VRDALNLTIKTGEISSVRKNVSSFKSDPVYWPMKEKLTLRYAFMNGLMAEWFDGTCRAILQDRERRFLLSLNK